MILRLPTVAEEPPIPGKPRRQAAPKDPGKERLCERCGSRLSRYNPGKTCLSHDDPRDAALPTLHATKK